MKLANGVKKETGKMKVELNISNDSELRNVIKDMIAGQIKNIAREKLQEMISAEVSKLMQNDSSIRNMIQSEFRAACKNQGTSIAIENAAKQCITEFNENVIRQKVGEDFMKHYGDVNDLIARQVNDKVSKAVKNIKVSL